MAELVVTPYSEYGIHWQIRDLPYIWQTATYVRAELQNASGGVISTIPYGEIPTSGSSHNTSTKSYSSTNAFTPGRSYTSYGYVVTPGGSYIYSGSASYIMPINAPSGLTSIDKTHSTITLSWNEKDGAINYRIRYKKSTESTYSTVLAGGTSYAFTGLSPNTTYNFAILAIGQYASSSYSSTVNVTTSPMPLSKFWWEGGKSSGTPFNVTYWEWLDLYDKIDAVHLRLYGTTYGFNRTSSYYAKGKPFYAWMFTDAAKAIRMFDTSVPVTYTNFKKDDPIYGSHLLNLQSALNSKIDQLNS